MSMNHVQQEFKGFVDNFLDSEQGCGKYLLENKEASRVLSLAFVPPDIITTDEIKPNTYMPSNGYDFTNPNYQSSTSEEVPFQFDTIYDYNITNSFLQHAFKRCDEEIKYQNIHVETEAGLQEQHPIYCLELEKTTPEAETSRFVCTDPMKSKLGKDQKYDYEHKQPIKCPQYLNQIVQQYQSGKGYCQHFPDIISENFLVVDKCPQEKVLGKKGMFENAKGRQLLWDPSTQRLRCQVDQPSKGGFVTPQYSLS